MTKNIKPIYSDKRMKHRNSLILVILFFIFFIISLKLIVNHIQNDDRPSVNKYPIMGVMIDQTDNYQDFNSLYEHGIAFVYLRVTQGSSYSDDYFDSNYSRIKGTQLPCGFFHIVSFDTDAKSQFKNITDTILMQRGTLPFVLKVSAYGDYEHKGIPKKKALKIIRSLRKNIKNYYGDNCIIQLDESTKQLAKYFPRVWYVSNNIPSDKKWLIWQYGNNNKIPGLAGSNNYKLSVLNGNKKLLNSLVQNR